MIISPYIINVGRGLAPAVFSILRQEQAPALQRLLTSFTYLLYNLVGILYRGEF